MKKLLSMILVLVLATAMFSVAALGEAAAPVRIASMKGPTSMGLYHLLNGEYADEYQSSVHATGDEIVPLLAKGEVDIAMVPCNLASVLYNNLNGGVKVVLINTLGVLYVLEKGETVNEIADLAGKTLVSTGKNTTPEYALNYILGLNGMESASDLTIEYKSEAAEASAALLAGEADLAVLPQPFVTTVLMKDETVRVALSLTEEWDKVNPESALVTGVAIVRTEFAEENPEAVEAFIERYAASAAYVNENPAEAAEWIASLGIVGNAKVAEKAIPACNLVAISGAEMQEKVSGYLTSLYDQNPAAVGGKLPDDAFYYGVEE